MRARCQLQGLRLSPWAEGVSQGSTWGIPRLPRALTPGIQPWGEKHLVGDHQTELNPRGPGPSSQGDLDRRPQGRLRAALL